MVFLAIILTAVVVTTSESNGQSYGQHYPNNQFNQNYPQVQEQYTVPPPYVRPQVPEYVPQKFPQQPARPPSTAHPLNEFDLNLLRETVADNPKGDVMISPVSVKAVLFMLAEGAVGDTRIELLNALGLRDISEVRKVWGNYDQQMKSRSSGVGIESGNAIFLSQNYVIKNEFNNIIRNVYSSNVTNVDFSRPQAAANNINNWVRQKTRNHIPKIVDANSFDASTIMVLTNALFFKGSWQYKFTGLDKLDCFKNEENNCIQSKYMTVENTFNYFFNRNYRFQAVDVPYVGSQYSMLLILSREPVDSLIKSLSYEVLNEAINSMEPNEVKVHMPKFTIDYSGEMRDILHKMNINSIFGRLADLKGIVQSNENPQVDNIIHKTKIVVNEEGSVAAASSAAMVVPLMGSTAINMKLDRPFLFFIRDTNTNVIFFAGRVYNPGKNIGPLIEQQKIPPSLQRPNSQRPGQATNIPSGSQGEYSPPSESPIYFPGPVLNYNDIYNSRLRQQSQTNNLFQDSLTTNYHNPQYVNNNNYRASVVNNDDRIYFNQ